MTLLSLGWHFLNHLHQTMIQSQEALPLVDVIRRELNSGITTVKHLYIILVLFVI